MDPSPSFRIATLNLLHDPPAPSWPDRAHLVVAGFRALRADVILLQEVAWPNELASDLATALSADTGSSLAARITPLVTPHGWQEGLAIFTRFPVLAHDALRYPAAEDFCQRVRVRVAGRVVDIYNAHLDPYSAERRREQIRLAVRWMQEHSDAQGLLVGGDLNATPDSDEIGLLRATLRSAHAADHGREPAGTTPTPGRHGSDASRRTVDYLWCSSTIGVQACGIDFDQPDPRDRSLYASDHFGLWADVYLTPAVS
jgi:endonuclease/exonuclease/phosphatase family metal-dependent hydrolase